MRGLIYFILPYITIYYRIRFYMTLYDFILHKIELKTDRDLRESRHSLSKQ